MERHDTESELISIGAMDVRLVIALASLLLSLPVAILAAVLL